MKKYIKFILSIAVLVLAHAAFYGYFFFLLFSFLRICWDDWYPYVTAIPAVALLIIGCVLEVKAKKEIGHVSPLVYVFHILFLVSLPIIEVYKYRWTNYFSIFDVLIILAFLTDIGIFAYVFGTNVPGPTNDKKSNPNSDSKTATASR